MNKQTIVLALVASIVGGLMVLVFGGLVGNQSDGTGVGAGTRFPNGLSVDSTSPSAGEIRGTTLTITGASTLTGAITATGGIDAGANIDASEGLTQGGGVLTIADAAAVTLTEAQMIANNVIMNTASTTAGIQTLTLPATSTMTTLIPTAGDSKKWFYQNNYTVAATTTQIVAGTGIVLLEPDEGDAFDVLIDGAAYAIITCFRKSDTNVACTVMEATNAD